MITQVSDAPEIDDETLGDLVGIAEGVSETVRDAVQEAIERFPLGSDERRAMHRVFASLFVGYAVLEAVQDDMTLEQISQLIAINWDRFGEVGGNA